MKNEAIVLKEIFAISNVMENQAYVGNLQSNQIYQFNFKENSNKDEGTIYGYIEAIGIICNSDSENDCNDNSIHNSDIKTVDNDYRIWVKIVNPNISFINTKDSKESILMSDLSSIERKHLRFEDAPGLKYKDWNQHYKVYGISIKDKMFEFENYHLLKFVTKEGKHFGYIEDIRDGNVKLNKISFIKGKMFSSKIVISTDIIIAVIKQKIVIEDFIDKYAEKTNKDDSIIEEKETK